ncbi:MAG TPA: hypothetical protein VGD37_02060 [Kofleriaceae bacterium]
MSGGAGGAAIRACRGLPIRVTKPLAITTCRKPDERGYHRTLTLDRFFVNGSSAKMIGCEHSHCC